MENKKIEFRYSFSAEQKDNGTTDFEITSSGNIPDSLFSKILEKLTSTNTF